MSRHRRQIGSAHRGPAAALTLLAGLLRIILPLLIVGAAAYWIVTFRSSGSGTVRVTTSVPGADILVGGVQTGSLSDATIKLPLGRQIITVRKDNYISEPEFVVVDVHRKTRALAGFVLRSAREAIASDSIPPLRPVRQDIFSTGEPVREVSPGARPHRFLNFAPRNTAPATSSRVPSTEIETSTPTEQSSVPSSDPSSAALVSTQITVSSNPDGAEILVNGQPTSHLTPYTFRGLDRGVYSFRVHREGNISKPDSITVSLTTDFQRELAVFELSPDLSLPQPTLSISTTPLAAAIRVDGKQVGVGKVTVNSGFGEHRVEFADVPGFKTPDPVTVSLTAQQLRAEASGMYERLTGNSYIAVVPSDEIEKFDGRQLRVYVDNELILDGPRQRFDATLLGRLVPGKRLVRVQYGDLSGDAFLNLMDNEVIEVTFRIESFFSKRKLKLRDKPVEPIEQWQQKMQKLNILSVT